MSRIDKKTVDWVCKIMREDARKHAKKDNPNLYYLPAALRVRERLNKSFMSIPKKDLHNKNKRAVFLLNAMSCADIIADSFVNDWCYITSYENNYYRNADEE